MRENLIGYLLNALEPSERAAVEAELVRQPELKSELDLLSRSLQPLAADAAPYPPPVGLASRCCEFVAVKSKVSLPPPVTSAPPRWSMADIGVAAGVFLAASLLFWPAMNQSRYAAQVRQCQNNLGQIGVAHLSYSDLFPGRFPALSLRNPHARAGAYAVILRQQGLLPEQHILICPASELAEEADSFNVPTIEELDRARAQAKQLAQLHKKMGGSYSFSLGFYEPDGYHSPQDLRRSRHALMADAPTHTNEDRISSNHGGCGLNVLFEDMHVEYVTTCRSRACQDHLFQNREGKHLAGLDRDDVVLGSSDAAPVVVEPSAE
jgi:hypothetical protein